MRSQQRLIASWLFACHARSPQSSQFSMQLELTVLGQYLSLSLTFRLDSVAEFLLSLCQYLLEKL